MFSCSDDGEIHKINPAYLTLNKRYTEHSGQVKTIVQKNCCLYSGSSDNTIHKINTATMTKERQYDGHTGTVTDLAFDDDENLYSCSDDGTIHKLNPIDMNAIVTNNVNVSRFVFGNGFLFGISGGEIVKIDSSSLVEIERNDLNNDILTSISFGREFIYVSTTNGKVIKVSQDLVILVEFQPFSTRRLLNLNRDFSMTDVTFGKDDFVYCIGIDNSFVFKLEKETLRLVGTFDDVEDSGFCIQWGIDVFCGYNNGTIRKIESLSMLEKGPITYSEHTDVINKIVIDTNSTILYKYLKT